MANALNLVVPEDLVKEVRKKAIDEEVSVSAVVRSFLVAWVGGTLPTPQSARDEGKEQAANQALAPAGA